MLFNVRVLRSAIALCFICGVTSIPRPEQDRDNKKLTAENGKTAKDKIGKTTITLPTTANRQTNKKDDKHKSQRQGGAITGSIEINDENIEGHIEIPDKDENDPIDNNQNNFKGSVNNDGDNEDISDINDDNGQNTKKSGKVNIPHETLSDVESDNNKRFNNDTISGSIEINDDNIEGTINIPDDDTIVSPYDAGSNNGQTNDEDALTGTIEINDDSIEGTINIPDDIDTQPNIKNEGDSNDNLPNEDGSITGTIEINDDNIEGAINIPDEYGTLPNVGDVIDDDDISGSINIDDENISGTINIPDEADDEAKMDGDNTHNDEIGGISGTIEIDEEGNIEGDINIDDGENENESKESDHSKQPETDNDNNKANDDGQSNDSEGSCWMDLHAKNYLDALDQLDAKYQKAREQYQNEIGPEFDKRMMEVLLSSQGKAPRAVHQAQGDFSIIPAGLNLGGYGMMRMQGSVLFFHRMKLRNNTKFRVDFLQADMMEMSLVGRLTLHDIHLQGAYERTTTHGMDMSTMHFVPSYGELEVLLRDVFYKMEGRLRLLNNRLMIELVNSAIVAKEILLTYANSSSATKVLMRDNIDDFIDRLKSDLDIWLKDYFNDYLMYFGIVGGKNSEVQLYEKQKTIKVNEYADHAIKGIKERIKDMGATTTRLPHFTITTIKNQKIKLNNGVLRGLDSMYRRSVAMTKKEKQIRTIDTIIGFSDLKVEYRYEAVVSRGQPVLLGMLVLSADELTAHLELSHIDNVKTVDMNLDTIIQLKSESLTVEGPASRLISDIQYVLENPIIAIMTNVMKHNIKMLKTLPRCDPRLWGAEERRPARLNSWNSPKIINTRKPNLPVNKDGEIPYGAHDQFKDREQGFIHNSDVDVGWEDYVFSKNDSVEIEVPINGKMEKMKLDRNENFVLSKLP